MDEWSIFFGRERMIDEVIHRLADRRLVMVHGGSGSGKSSLIRAGVLPRLARHNLRSGRPWRVCAMRPGDGPLWKLAQALADIEGRGDDTERISLIRREFDRAGARLATIVAASVGLAGGLCLLIDQFEEIFRFAKKISRAEAELFVELLVGLLDEREDDVDLRVVLTMRSEFLGDCALFDGLAEAVNDCQYLLPRLDRDSLRRAIRRPAEIYGGEVRTELVDRLIDDACDAADELPLIQHGLMQLWSQARTRADEQSAESGTHHKPVLDLELYTGRGDLSARLSHHADQVMARATRSEADRRVVEAIFRALTDINAEGQAIRRPQMLAELVDVTGRVAADLREILEPFRQRDVAFVAPYLPQAISETTLIDIGHEALIRNWRKISGEPGAGGEPGWLRQEFDDGLAWRSLLMQAREFESDNRRILSPVTTIDRLEWLDLRGRAWTERYGNNWASVDALMRASTRARNRAILLARLAVGAIAVGLVAVIVLGLVTWSLMKPSNNVRSGDLRTDSFHVGGLDPTARER